METRIYAAPAVKGLNVWVALCLLNICLVMFFYEVSVAVEFFLQNWHAYFLQDYTADQAMRQRLLLSPAVG